MLAVKYVAQADTVVPGALPTLFPIRLLFLFILTVSAGGTLIIYCGSKILQQPTSMRFITCLGCSILFLIPFPGWLVMVWVLYRRLHVAFSSIILLILLSVAFCLLTVWLGAYMLDLTDLQRIYMELKAGYG